MEMIARLGYTAKGIVYAIVGILAVQAAFTAGGKTTDTQGALHTIAAQPFGKFLLILLAVGLVAYSLWRFIEAIADPDNKGTDVKGIISRIGYVSSGLVYMGLALNAAMLALGSGGGGSGNSKQDWTGRLLAQPFGQWLVGIVGAFVIGLGFYRLYKAYQAKFRKKLKLSQMSSQEEAWAVNISRVGIAARGIVFMIIGFFLIKAARQYDPSEVRGLDGVLQATAQQPFGKFLLALLAIGLIAYAVYLFVEARYRRIGV
ncbi:MAG: DUF1206 domain-containing protein [Okeania sp. SIO2D1]|nr:DUF1206 domain-containing protein [Okeania sp. SIO2D1]